MLKKTITPLVLALFLRICPAAAEANVAVIAPRVGEFKVFGDELVDGVRIAVDDINARGGVLGERVNLLVVDDQCDGTFAVSTAQMMAVNASRDRMDLVIGPYCQNDGGKVADVYARAGIFQIIPIKGFEAGESNPLLQTVRLAGTSKEQGKTFYDFYAANFAGKKIALVYDSTVSEAKEIATKTQEEFFHHQQGDVIRLYDVFQDREKLTSLARRIVGEGNEIVYLLGKAYDVAKLARDLKDENESTVLFINRYQVMPYYRDMLGDLAEGTYMLALPSLKNNADFTETLVRLRLLGREPVGVGVYGYSALNLWAEAAEAANSFEREDLNQALQKSEFSMPWGKVSFKGGVPSVSAGYAVYRLQDGEYAQVY